MIIHSPPVGYRVNVGAMIISHDKRIWMGKRVPQTETPHDQPWQMPQGGIEPNETPQEAALREVFEETGLVSLTLLEELQDWITYDLPPDLASSLWEGKYLGQVQKWFAFSFFGDESETNLALSQLAAPEFYDWTWMKPEQVADKAIWFKRTVYETVLDRFSPYLT